MATKKRTLSAAGRKKIAEAQKKRWQETRDFILTPAPAATGPAQQQDQKESPTATIQRLAGEIGRLQNIVRAYEVCIEDDREALADYAGILKRELAYHKLRVEEITRDLRHNCIDV